MAQQTGAVKNTNAPSLSKFPSDRLFREKPFPWFLKGRFWAGVCFYFAIGFFVLNILGLVGTVVVDSFGAHWFGGTWLPQGFTTSWYQFEVNDHDIGSLLFNTLFIASTVTVIALVAGFGAAYVLARKQFRFKGLLIGLYLLPMLLPPLVYGIPLATVLLKYLGGALPSVILINLVPVVPFVILILRPFVEQVDVSLESASRMLGANRFQTFWRVLLPLMMPGLLTAGILAMVRTIAMFELTFLVADARTQTLVVILYSDAFAAGLRPNQVVDAMAVIYTLTTMAMVIVALIFVKPTQFVVRLKKT
jgi:putative spermidine/putrescine transport system permease protein